MPVNVRVTGANQLGALARRLRAEGEQGKGLRRELIRELRREAQSLAGNVRDAIRRWPVEPPDDRGLREMIARRVRVKVRLTGRSPGVRITVGKVDGTNLPRLINRGSWRHPVFGNRDVWVTQTGSRGWFSRTIVLGARRVGRDVRAAMARVSRRITSG